MIVNFRGNLAGLKQGVNKNTGEPYHIYTFLDDEGNTLQCMCKDFTLATDLKRLAVYDVKANLNIGKYSSLVLQQLNQVKGA